MPAYLIKCITLQFCRIGVIVRYVYKGIPLRTNMTQKKHMNKFESLVWKAYWERVEADRAWLKDLAEEREALMREQNEP